MEDPGVVKAAYDYCPTGNNPALPGTPMTTIGMANPLRQYGTVYDDPTKLYFGPDGTLLADYSGVGTQGPALRFGNAISGVPASEPIGFASTQPTARRNPGTVGACISGSIGFIFYVGLSVCAVQPIIGSGPASLEVPGSAGHIVGAGVSVTVGPQFSNAPNVGALAGPSGTVGVTGGAGVAVDANTSVEANGVVATNVGVGAGVAIGDLPLPPVAGYGGVGYTAVLP